MCLAEGFRCGTITSVEDWKKKSIEAAAEIEQMQAAQQVAAPPSPAHVATTVASELTADSPFSMMTVVQLQAELRKRGLPVSGRKALLWTRLQHAVATASETAVAVWVKKPITEANFPAGDYYIGDLCYVLSDELYHGVWGDNFGYDPGYITNGTISFAMESTAYGDGEYEDDEGNKYPVDAGIIGIAPVSILKDRQAPGRYITFTEPVTFRGTGHGYGLFTITSGHRTITIET